MSVPEVERAINYYCPTMTDDSPAPDATVIDHLPTREGYDRWASIYDDEGNPLVLLEAPHVMRLLGDEKTIELPEGFSRRLYRRLMLGV